MQPCLGVIVRLSHEFSPLLVQGGVGGWDLGSGGREKHPFTTGNLCPALRQLRGGQRTLPAFADSQLLSSQNNPYAKEAYSGVVNSDPLPRENHQEPNLLEDLVPWSSTILLSLDRGTRRYRSPMSVSRTERRLLWG